jgi:hypothetical protein
MAAVADGLLGQVPETGKAGGLDSSWRFDINTQNKWLGWY